MEAQTSTMPPRRWMGRGRGVLSFASKQQNAQTERRPGNNGAYNEATSLNQSTRPSDNSRTDMRQQQQQPAYKQPGTAADQRRQQQGDVIRNQRDTPSSSRLAKPQTQSGASGDDTSRKTPAKVLLAKYSYKANPDSPLGFPELNTLQGQKLILVEKHQTNEHWWKAQDETGTIGYVPASYMMIQEVEPSALPWLAEKKAQEPEVSEKPVWKPYVSAYNKPAESSDSKETANKLDYYCEVCDKKLNGPKPYGAHMTSKSHKEEVEVAREMGRL